LDFSLLARKKNHTPQQYRFKWYS